MKSVKFKPADHAADLMLTACLAGMKPFQRPPGRAALKFWCSSVMGVYNTIYIYINCFVCCCFYHLLRIISITTSVSAVSYTYVY